MTRYGSMAELIKNLPEETIAANPELAASPEPMRATPCSGLMQIVIPEHTTPSVNTVLYEQRHWKHRKDEAERIHKLVWAYAPTMAYPYTKPVNVHVTAYRHRTIDADNVPAKLYVDGLRKCGILTDDSRKYLHQVTTECKPTTGKDCVVITITEATE